MQLNKTIVSFSTWRSLFFLNLSATLYHSSFAIAPGFCLVDTTQKQVLKIIQDIKSSKAAGVNKLSVKFLKDGSGILAKQVSALCNLSISRGAFASACKVAKLKPIFEKGKKSDPSNYIPISLLPLISKIIEKVVHCQTNIFSF